MILQKHFSHPSLVIYFFPKPTHKTEIGTANRWETTDSKAPEPILIGLASQKQGAAVRSELSQSSPACVEQLHWCTVQQNLDEEKPKHADGLIDKRHSNSLLIG